MRGWLGTVVLLAALVGAFIFSWHGMREEPPSAQAAAPLAVPVPPREPPAPARKPATSYSFGGYPCVSKDCAEDLAGFRWAERNVISDPDSCTGATSGFIEGCRVYVERHRASLR